MPGISEFNPPPWGKRWGAQGIGRLREVAMVRPTETEVKKLYEEDSRSWSSTARPRTSAMQQQHLDLARTYERLDIKVHYSSWSEDPPRSAYGPRTQHFGGSRLCHQWRRDHSARGDALLARPLALCLAVPVGIGCPILYTVHGTGVCEIGASTRMSDDFIVLMLSTDCNREGADQVIPILERAGYREIHVAHSPGPLQRFPPEVPGWMHSGHVDHAARRPPGADLSAVVRLRDNPAT